MAVLCITPAGDLAKTTSPEEVGRATGELCAAMAKIDLGDTVIPIPPYFKVFDVHHAINKDKFYQKAASNPAFEVGDHRSASAASAGILLAW